MKLKDSAFAPCGYKLMLTSHVPSAYNVSQVLQKVELCSIQLSCASVEASAE